MHVINVFTGGRVFAAGELLIMQYRGAICIASHCIVDELGCYYGTGVICMPCNTGKQSILSFRGFTSIDLQKLGLSHDSRECGILNNYYYRHIHCKNSSKIGSRNVEMALHSILHRLW